MSEIDYVTMLLDYHGFKTAPAERGKAEEYISRFYNFFAIKSPTFYWADSPFEACIMGRLFGANYIECTPEEALLSVLGKSKHLEAMNCTVDLSELKRKILNGKGIQSEKSTYAEVIKRYISSFGSGGMAYGRTNNLAVTLETHLRSILPRSVPDEHLIFGYGSIIVDLPDTYIFPSIFRYCHGFIIHNDLCICVERPTKVVTTGTQEAIRFHNTTGPALEYKDGFKAWVYKGIIVDKRIIEEPNTITSAEILASGNIERRRVLLEMYGTERFLMDSNAEMIDKSKHGRLYRKRLAGDEALVMVRVKNGTPEADGTYKEYFLRVPPNMTTAKQAVAWTFNMDEERMYAPTIQT